MEIYKKNYFKLLDDLILYIKINQGITKSKELGQINPNSIPVNYINGKWDKKPKDKNNKNKNNLNEKNKNVKNNKERFNSFKEKNRDVTCGIRALMC